MDRISILNRKLLVGSRILKSLIHRRDATRAVGIPGGTAPGGYIDFPGGSARQAGPQPSTGSSDGSLGLLGPATSAPAPAALRARLARPPFWNVVVVGVWTENILITRGGHQADYQSINA